MRALPIDVYRHGKYDCTNGGISSRFTELLLICDNGFITIDDENPPENAVKLVKRHLFGSDIYHIEPLTAPKGAGWMMGGNYAATSDSRFRDMVGGMYGAVAIHDRQESWKDYDMYSR